MARGVGGIRLLPDTSNESCASWCRCAAAAAVAGGRVGLLRRAQEWTGPFETPRVHFGCCACAVASVRVRGEAVWLLGASEESLWAQLPSRLCPKAAYPPRGTGRPSLGGSYSHVVLKAISLLSNLGASDSVEGEIRSDGISNLVHVPRSRFLCKIRFPPSCPGRRTHFLQGFPLYRCSSTALFLFSSFPSTLRLGLVATSVVSDDSSPLIDTTSRPKKNCAT